MHGAVKLFTVIGLFSLPTVMFGGYSLLRLLIAKKLNDFQIAYFRAGHAHAGVLIVLALVVLDVVDRNGLSSALEWTIGVLLIVGIVAQSGGMFVHMAIGKPGKWSMGNTLTTAGALVLTAALVTAAIGVIGA
jgi:heme/copper-type cytochrome/quinol oxidase subunit 4